MATVNSIEIKKRSSEEVACWKVHVDELTPNTMITCEPGVTALLKIDGQTKLLAGNEGGKLANSLMNPGKGAKLIGGNKAYDSVEIYAIDQSTEFFAEWGLAGNMAIPAYDPDNDVDCNVVAFGEYFYKVGNFASFIGTFPFEGGVVTRDAIREFLRAETAGIIKSYLTGKLSAFGLRACQTRLTDMNESIRDAINKHLDSKGLTVYNFVILKLSYDPKHEAALKAIKDAKLDVKVKQITNVGRKDDISVRKDDVDVDISLIKAKGDAARGTNSNNNNNNNNEGNVIFCSRCGERNVNSNYCCKCGEKLNGRRGK